MIVLADEAPVTHPTISLCGSKFCTLNADSVIMSLVAFVLTLAMAFWVARRLSSGRPGKLQMLFESFLSYVRDLVKDSVAEDATFIIPIAATIGFYILVANWLDFFPLPGKMRPPASDVNQTLALGILVIVIVQAYSVRVLGVRGFLRRFTRPFDMNMLVRTLFVPLNIIEEVVKPVTLALRLFGNIFAGILMVWLLSQFTVLFTSKPFLLPGGAIGLALLTAWKAFDVFFIGSLQAFIFMLLTVIYFGLAREGLEEEAHTSPAQVVHG